MDHLIMRVSFRNLPEHFFCCREFPAVIILHGCFKFREGAAFVGGYFRKISVKAFVDANNVVFSFHLHLAQKSQLERRI